MGTETSRKSNAPDPLVGRTLVNRFRVVERIATGGMGAVYKAEQIPLGREVAIKILEAKQVLDTEDTFKQRFFLEAAAAATLKHPNTIVVYDYGQSDEGMYFIAMEYIDGVTLERRLKKHGPVTPAQALHIALQVSSSLRDAHEHGLVHRDMKPGNIMFAPRARDPLFVKVLDFGLVKHVSGKDDDPSLTQGGVVMGSPRYMAPEQVRTMPVDHRTDIYSLGATLYHMVAGAPPFAAGKPFDAMSAQVTTPPPPLKTTWPDCPAGPRLEALIMRCLEKNPEARFQSMDELMNELQACFDEAGAGLPAGSSFMSHMSSLQLSLDGSDSDPRLNATPSGMKWKESDSAPKISGARPRQAVEEDIEVDVPTSAYADPASLAKKRNGKWIALGLVAAVAVVVGLLGAWMFAGDPDASASEAASSSASRPADRPAASTLVQVRSEPPGAIVRHAGADIGDTPLRVPVPTGERWEVELALDGYEPRRVTLLAGQPEMTIHLRPAAAPPQPAAEAEESAQTAEPPRRRWPVRRPESGTTPPQPPTPAEDTTARPRSRDLHDPWGEQ